jgi:hypothetical protein
MQVQTPDLFVAAFLRSVGATVVRYEDGPRGQGVVVLDTSTVCQARLAAEASALARQLTQIPDSPTIDVAELAINNTLLGVLSDHLSNMRKTILNRRRA